MKQLLYDYNKKKTIIKQRLAEFAEIKKKSCREIFPELCFCLLTPQSKAINCDKAVQNLKRKNLLYNGGQKQISSVLKGLVRFHNNKSKYIVESRRKMSRIKDICGMPNHQAREWLVENIKGMSFKEACHFLRNIGKGEGLAIIDRHILNNLKKYGVLKDIPKSITPRLYIEIENKMKRFSDRTGIPLEELDLLFWSKQTGYVFK